MDDLFWQLVCRGLKALNCCNTTLRLFRPLRRALKWLTEEAWVGSRFIGVVETYFNLSTEITEHCH